MQLDLAVEVDKANSRVLQRRAQIEREVWDGKVVGSEEGKASAESADLVELGPQDREVFSRRGDLCRSVSTREARIRLHEKEAKKERDFFSPLHESGPWHPLPGDSPVLGRGRSYRRRRELGPKLSRRHWIA